jgi:hypothetical protein
MGKVFISYRRGDSSGYTGRLFDTLRDRFGSETVFRDIDNLEPGVDFVEALENALLECDCMLVIIGDEWSSASGPGGRRLEQPNDYVRMEIAKALERNVRVIPVLVANASMPTAEELPDNLAGLVRRNALEISDTRWDYDVGRLGDTLAKVLGIAEEPATNAPEHASPTTASQSKGRSFALIGGGAILGILALVVLAAFLDDGTDTNDFYDQQGQYTCPIGVRGCSEDNLCSSCDDSCGYCQNLESEICGPEDCMTCNEGYALSQVYEDGTGFCEPE